MKHFPLDINIYGQCAYYFRAFSRGQIFLDANHRTGYFSLTNILRKKGIIINASLSEITAMTEYMKAQGWIKQGEMNVSLTEKVIHLHFFIGSCDWYVAEISHKNWDLMFGYANLGDSYNAEWGYVSLSELKSLKTGPVEVDFDHYWIPTAFKNIKI